MEIGFYQHYKGNFYKVLHIAKCAETLQEMVVYQNILTNEVWTRPKLEFCSKVKPQGSDDTIDRFKLITNTKKLQIIYERS